MYRSSFTTLFVAVVLCATLSVAAVSEFGKSVISPENVVPESVFDDVATEPVFQIEQDRLPPVPPHPQGRAISENINGYSTIPLESYQNWKQVGAVNNKETRSHQVRLTSDGMLPGRVILLDPRSGLPQTAKNIAVFFIKMGVVSGAAKPGPNGVFQATGILPGVYGVAVLGKEAFASFSVHVLPESDENGGHHDIEPLRLEIAAIPSGDAPLALRLFQPYLGQGHLSAPIEPDEKYIPAETKVTNSVINSPKGTTAKKHSVFLKKDGSLIGRIRRLHPKSGHPFLLRSSSAHIYFAQNNKIVYQVGIDKKGFFRIPNFAPGVYSVISAGEDGIGAIACRVVSPEKDVKQPVIESASQFLKTPSESEIKFVSFLQQGGGEVPSEFDITMLGPENFEAMNQLLAPTNFSDLMGGGGAGTGGGGGGGSTGGLSSLAPLGALGLLGLLASP